VLKVIGKMIYNENQINDNVYIRTFSSNVDQEELVWHRDWEDRLIEPLNDNDWYFQFDNSLPIKIDKPIFIKAHTWHRVIKGNSELKIKLTKYPAS